jgi:hypothetical protein
VEFHPDFANVIRFAVRAGTDGIRRVLHQLPNKDFRPAVEMVRKEINYPTEIDLKFVFHRFLQGSGPLRWY